MLTAIFGLRGMQIVFLESRREKSKQYNKIADFTVMNRICTYLQPIFIVKVYKNFVCKKRKGYLEGGIVQNAKFVYYFFCVTFIQYL